MNPGDFAHVVVNGAILAEVQVMNIGPGTKFDFLDVATTHAVVFGLHILDETAAAAQRAWLDDGDCVEEGVTPLTAISTKIMIAVPLAHIHPRPLCYHRVM